MKAIEVREERLKEMLTVSGRITSFKEFQLGTSVDLTDETGTFNVWFRDNIRKLLPGNLIKEGAALRVTGEIGKFKARVQLLPAGEADIQVETAPITNPTADPAHAGTEK